MILPEGLSSIDCGGGRPMQNAEGETDRKRDLHELYFGQERKITC
jgi:hypothetical protein